MDIVLKKISEIEDNYYYSTKKKENDIFLLLLQFRELSDKIITDICNTNDLIKEDFIKFTLETIYKK